MNLSDALSNPSAFWAGLIAVCGVLYKTVKSLLEFNDEYLRKRRFTRLSYLREQAPGSTELATFLSRALEEEVMRAVFGQPIPHKPAQAYLQLYSTGRFSVAELQATFLYTKVKDGQVVFEPGKLGALILVASLFFIAAMGIYVGVAVFNLLVAPSAVSLATVAAVLCFYFFFAWYFGRDIRAVLLAHRAKKRLAKPAPQSGA